MSKQSEPLYPAPVVGEGPLELQASRVRRNPWVTALACIPCTCIPAPYAIGPSGPGVVPMTLLVALICCALFFMVWRERPYPRIVPARIRVTPDELRVGETTIARSQIRWAELIPIPQAPPLVRISRTARIDLDVAADSAATAHDILIAIGFHSSQSTAIYRISSLARVRYRWVAPLWVVASLVALFGGLGITVFLSVPVFLLVFAWPASLAVGVDATFVRWRWVRERVVNRDIFRVARFDEGRRGPRGVRLDLNDGRVLKLPVASDDMIATIMRRIECVRTTAAPSKDVDDGGGSLTFESGGQRHLDTETMGGEATMLPEQPASRSDLPCSLSGPGAPSSVGPLKEREDGLHTRFTPQSRRLLYGLLTIASLVWSVVRAINAIDAHVGYSTLGIDPNRASIDDMVQAVEERAFKWRRDAVLYSIHLDRVRPDGSMDLTYSAPTDTPTSYHVYARLEYASPSYRGHTINFDFRPPGLYVSTTRDKENSVGAEPALAPDCTVRLLADALAAQGLTDPDTVKVSSSAKTRVWRVHGDSGSGRAPILGDFSLSNCERIPGT